MTVSITTSFPTQFATVWLPQIHGTSRQWVLLSYPDGFDCQISSLASIRRRFSPHPSTVQRHSSSGISPPSRLQRERRQLQRLGDWHLAGRIAPQLLTVDYNSLSMPMSVAMSEGRSAVGERIVTTPHVSLLCICYAV